MPGYDLPCGWVYNMGEHGPIVRRGSVDQPVQLQVERLTASRRVQQHVVTGQADAVAHLLCVLVADDSGRALRRDLRGRV